MTCKCLYPCLLRVRFHCEQTEAITTRASERSHFTMAGGIMMALKRNASNTAASRLGIVLSSHRTGNTVIKWELWSEAALIASMQAWYLEMEALLHSRPGSKIKFALHFSGLMLQMMRYWENTSCTCATLTRLTSSTGMAMRSCMTGSRS